MVESDNDEAPLGGKRRQEPGTGWYCWACCNNERACLLLFYVVSFFLNLVSLSMVLSSAKFAIEVEGEQLFAPVLFPPFNEVIKVDRTADAEIVNCVNNENVMATSVFTASVGPGLRALLAFITILLAGGLAVALRYAVLDLQGHIIYRRMEAYYRGLLFSSSGALAFGFLIKGVINVYGVSYYAGSGTTCFDQFIEKLAGELGNRDFEANFRALVNANQTAQLITVAAFGLTSGCVALYASLFCSTRTWFDTKGFDPRRMEMTNA